MERKTKNELKKVKTEDFVGRARELKEHFDSSFPPIPMELFDTAIEAIERVQGGMDIDKRCINSPFHHPDFGSQLTARQVIRVLNLQDFVDEFHEFDWDDIKPNYEPLYDW